MLNVEEIVKQLAANHNQLVLAKSKGKIKFQILYDGDEWIANNNHSVYCYEYSNWILEEFLSNIETKYGIDEIEFIDYSLNED